MSGKFAAFKFCLLTLVLGCAVAQAATTGPTYTATLKLGKGNVAVGSVLSIQGKAIDFISLLNLQKTATAKGVTVTMNEQVDVFTSNGNARLTFFSTSGTGVITTNGNVNPAPFGYTVKVDKKGNVTAKSVKVTKGVFPQITFSAQTANPLKNSFKFVFSGTQVDTAVAGLPQITVGKKTLPALGDKKTGTPSVTKFTLQLGSSTFVGSFSKGKIVFP